MKSPIKLISVALLSLSLLLTLTPATAALPPEHWFPGQEYHYFGHYFTEEYWTNDSITIQRDENVTANLIASYINYNGTGAFQAFLLALGTVENDGSVFTLPYQFLGMHYITPKGQEVFLGAILAFLYLYIDDETGTYNNSLPDPGNEPFYYVIPYGYGDTPETKPKVTAIQASNPAPNEYLFGVTYENLYARIVDPSNPFYFWLTLLRPAFTAKFSELTVTYHFEINSTTGEVTTETFYTIGQITELWTWTWNGTHWVENPIDPSLFREDEWGIGAAHHVTMFRSKYSVINGTTTLSSGVEALENVTIHIGDDDERAFKIGFRGTYDLINETATPPTVVNESLPAYTVMVRAFGMDHVFVRWQRSFFLDLLCTLSYALSPELRAMYNGPLDVYNHVHTAFRTPTFWYATAFPNFGGYRVEHDPVYTAYTNIGQGPTPEQRWWSLVFVAGLALVGVIALIVVVVVITNRKRGA